MGLVIVTGVDWQIFSKNVARSAAFVESLRPNRTEGIGAEEWSESINVTVTTFHNICTYDQKNDKSKKIANEILLLRTHSSEDPLSELCKIWRILYYKCNINEK